jgi:alcohol dehydrogenase, propanol-preferring
MTDMMNAWSFAHPALVTSRILKKATRPIVGPGEGELLIEVSACGVCRTDLHLIHGELPSHRHRVVPGHQVVGRVVSRGRGTDDYRPGERVGIAWLRMTCGSCTWCRRGAENLCPSALYTGWDADGGLAEYARVPAAYAYRLPDGYSDERIAPLLCAGIIGYRALRRANLPPGGRLGLFGFGSSAHITAQVAASEGAEIYVMTRGEPNQKLAASLGAAFVGGPEDRPPRPLDSAIVFAPAGELVPLALESTDRGGTVTLAGIHMSDIPQMSYATLFNERDLRTVTSNTREDGEELLQIARHLDLDIHTTAFDFDHADEALIGLYNGAYAGSGVVLRHL